MNYSSIWNINNETPISGSVLSPSIKGHNVFRDVVLTKGSEDYVIKTPIHDFKDFSIDKYLLEGYAKCGFWFPTMIQCQALPVLFEETADHIMIHAPNASGKTTAGLMALLQRINPDERCLQAVVICPTCEVAKRNYDFITDMTSCHRTLTSQLVMRGQSGRKVQVTPHLLVGTPEKVLELSKTCDTFSTVRWILIDGVESMIYDRGHQKCLHSLATRVHRNHIFMMLCSLPHSDTTEEFRDQLCKFRPLIMEFKDTSKQPSVKVYFASYDLSDERLAYLELTLRETIGQIIVFCKTKDDLQYVDKYLAERNYNAACICGKFSLAKREETRQQFQNGCIRILVTTSSFDDIRAENLQVVINFELIKDQKGFLDHYIYRKRAGLLSENSNGFVLNLLNERWVEWAVDENNAKMNIYNRKSFLKEIRKNPRFTLTNQI